MSIPPRIRVSSWTPERDAVLRRLWDSGMTIKAIGAAMGVTPNSAIGRAHRLQLAGRPSPISGAGQPRPPRPVRVAKVAPAPSVDVAPLPVAAPIPPFVPFRDCQWPTSAGPPWAFCGAPSVPSCPYCEPHLRKSRVQHRVAA